MAIYTAYYDASGTQDDDHGALVVVGLLGTVSRWLRFEREWERMLKSFGVSHFHMTDYAHSVGPFKGWRGQHERRAAFMKTAISTLQRAVNKVFVSGVYMPHFRIVDAEFELSETWSPDRPDAGAFAHCAHTCNEQVAGWMSEKKPGKRVHHVFEHGDTGMGAFQAGLPLVRDYDLSVSFVPKVDPTDQKRARPFEGADLVAWEYRNLYGQMIGKNTPPRRRSLVSVILQLPQEEGCLDEKSLRVFCADCDIPKRRRG